MKSYKKNLIKIKFYQTLLVLVYILVAFVGPIAYAFLRTTTGSLNFNFALTYSQNAVIEKGASLSFTFVFTVAVGVLNFSKFMKERIAKLEYGVTLQVIYFIKGASLPFALWSLAWYIGGWSQGSEAFIVIGIFLFLGNCVIKLFLNYYDYLVSKETRKNEMREVLDERAS